MKKIKRVNLRFSIEDEMLLNRVKEVIGISSTSIAIRKALQYFVGAHKVNGMDSRAYGFPSMPPKNPEEITIIPPEMGDTSE